MGSFERMGWVKTPVLPKKTNNTYSKTNMKLTTTSTPYYIMRRVYYDKRGFVKHDRTCS